MSCAPPLRVRTDAAAYLEVVAQEHVGQVFATSNCIGTVPGILCPLLVELITRRYGGAAGYRIAFAIFGFGVGVPALALFLTLFRAEPVRLRLKGESAAAAAAPPETCAPR